MFIPSPTRVNALHQPSWPDDCLADSVYQRLRSGPPVVQWADSHALLDGLARVNAGEAFTVMAGDCAELFNDTTPSRVVEKARHKPRSQSHETLPDGRVVLSYRGDAVNGFGQAHRRPDPTRMVTACHIARNAVHALNYEHALVRHEGRHASSAHFLWIGDRTRRPDHAHMAFAAGISNPIGIKLGPSATPSDVRLLGQIVQPERNPTPGWASLIVRMGAEHCADVLPEVLDALGRRAADFVWSPFSSPCSRSESCGREESIWRRPRTTSRNAYRTLVP
jgi:3-deoxy-7-phosphoheptulonate synthase